MMSELRELYHEIIIDHGRSPRNFRVLPHATQSKEGYNPLCGDKIHLFIDEKAGVIKEANEFAEKQGLGYIEADEIYSGIPDIKYLQPEAFVKVKQKLGERKWKMAFDDDKFKFVLQILKIFVFNLLF